MNKRFKVKMDINYKYYNVAINFERYNAYRIKLEMNERRQYESKIMKEIDVKEGEMDAVRIVCKNWRLD